MREIIERAVRGGWNIAEAMFKDGFVVSGEELNKDNFFNRFILTHPFLKAYFGEGYLYFDEVGGSAKHPDILFEMYKDHYIDREDFNDSLWEDYAEIFAWQYHGQQLFLSEDREEYLRRYL